MTAKTTNKPTPDKPTPDKPATNKPASALPTFQAANLTPNKPGRNAEPNPWVDVLKNLPPHTELAGWSVAQGFVTDEDTYRAYLPRIRAAGRDLNIGVAVQAEPNATDEDITTDDGFTVKPGQYLVRFATRPRTIRKAKPTDENTADENTAAGA